MKTSAYLRGKDLNNQIDLVLVITIYRKAIPHVSKRLLTIPKAIDLVRL